MAATFADLIHRPAARPLVWVRDGMLVMAASALVALCAKIQVPGPVPFTMQPWAVLLIGAALGSRRGALAIVAYLIEGAAGLPVFALPGAGPAYFLGPTGGYLLGFVPAAWLVGFFAERGWDRRFSTAVTIFALGQAVILLLGFVGLSGYLGVRAAFVEGVLLFLIGDTLKVLLAALALPAAWRVIGEPRR